MSTATKLLLSRAMSEYCTDNIWNEVAKEERVNVDPLLLTVNPVLGSVRFSESKYPLPTANTPYICYITTTVILSHLTKLMEDVWIDTLTLANKYHISYHAYDLDGRMLPKGKVWFRFVKNTSRVLIAIEAIPAMAIMDSVENLRITLYVDSDNNDCSYYEYDTSMSKNWTECLKQARLVQSRCPDGFTLFVDGYEYSDPQKVFTGSYITIVEDRDVVGSFTVPIALNDLGYYSTKDERDKLIVHIPKSLNPNNRLITHNTCSLYVRNPSLGKGLYFHRCMKKSVTTLTHNDFAVDAATLDTFAAAVGESTTDLHVKVRTHSKDNVLVDDASYIAYLYNETDAQIVAHLRKEIEATLDFWSADALESSIYVAMMEAMTEIVTEDDYSYYTESLGYYGTAALMCHHVRDYVITDAFAGFVVVPKPYVLYGATVVPVVYLNGIKVPHGSFSYVENANNTVMITLKKSVAWKFKDSLTITFHTGKMPTSEVLIPSYSHDTFTVNYSDVTLYRQVDVPATPSFADIFTQGYIPLEVVPGTISKRRNADGTTTLQFGASLFDQKIVVIPSEYAQVYQHDPANQIAEGLPLVVNLTMSSNAGVTPILGMKNAEVFLNGRYLVEGVDYYILTRKVDDAIIGIQCVVTNFTYLDLTKGNLIDLIVHTTNYSNVHRGYVVQNRLAGDPKIAHWYPGLSMAYVDGKLQLTVEEHVTYLTTVSPAREGAPYEVTTRIPTEVHQLLTTQEEYHDPRLDAIDAYFSKRPYSKPSLIYVVEQHKVYSPFIAMVIHDLITGKLQAVVDPDLASFLKQFSAYAYIRESDPTLTTNRTAVDLEFVNIHDTYKDMGYHNLEIYRVVDKLAKYYLGEGRSS